MGEQESQNVSGKSPPTALSPSTAGHRRLISTRWIRILPSEISNLSGCVRGSVAGQFGEMNRDFHAHYNGYRESVK